MNPISSKVERLTLQNGATTTKTKLRSKVKAPARAFCFDSQEKMNFS